MLDGAYIRAMPGHQIRNFEAICGKVEHEGHATRRFALVRSVAEQPHALLRAALLDQGWREGDVVTTLSNGDPALPALVRSATGGPVEPILDCWGGWQPREDRWFTSAHHLRQRCFIPRLLLGSGVMLGPLRNQAGDKGSEQGFAASTSVVHELKKAEIVRQLVLRDAAVRS